MAQGRPTSPRPARGWRAQELLRTRVYPSGCYAIAKSKSFPKIRPQNRRRAIVDNIFLNTIYLIVDGFTKQQLSPMYKPAINEKVG